MEQEFDCTYDSCAVYSMTVVTAAWVEIRKIYCPVCGHPLVSTGREPVDFDRYAPLPNF